MKKLLFFATALLCGAAVEAAPLWLRYPAISPDGSTIAFSYQGDLYTVPATGGKAFRLTVHPAYDYAPVWSPDGRQIAFASDRYGNFDIFVVAATGGQPVRLTTFSGKETPYAFTPDGKRVVYAAQIQDPARSAQFPTASQTELYSVALTGGRPRQELASTAESICYAADGSSFYYQDNKGFENAWRKHHTSSIARDLWHYDAASGRHTKLTANPGEDRDPRLSPDGKEIYFLSEMDGGSFNVYKFPVDAPAQVTRVTDFKTHPVRFLSMATDGTLCFGYDGEIYTRSGSGAPRRVEIEISGEQTVPDIEYLTYTSGSYDAAVSQDGKQVAVVVRGEVYATTVDYPTTKQITHTAAAEEDVSFSPDGRTLLYASERDGNWNIYTAKIVRDGEVDFAHATLIEETPLFKPSKTERWAPKFSPDGKEISYIEDRSRLMVKNLETGKVRQITDGSRQYTTTGSAPYAWSPDGKWFAIQYTGNRHEPYSDIGIVSAVEGGAIHNLTNSGYTDSNPRWVLDGNAILFNSERYGMRNHASWGSMGDVMIVFLNQDAYDKFSMTKEEYALMKEEEEALKKRSADKNDDKKQGTEAKKEEKEEKKDIEVELRNIEDRIVRLTTRSSSLGNATLSKDGSELFYMASFESGMDMWKLDTKSRSTTLLNKGTGNGALIWDKDYKNLFLIGYSRMAKMNAQGKDMKNISFRAELALDRAKERAYMFDHVYLQELKCFYTTTLHGVDWDRMKADYGKFLPYINNNYDFSEMLSEMLGELNVSHTGGRYSPRADASVSETTADLGVLYDLEWDGDGLKIAEVLEKGPFDKKASEVRAGDIIEKINGTPVTRGMDYFPLLNRQSGKKLLVSLYRPAEGKRWEEITTAITRSAFNALLYTRWVKQRAEEVDRLSGGRLGYVHIQSMGDPSFRSVYSDILGKYNDREGIVIDTRFNGGGRLHEDIEVLFSGEKYFTQVIRGKESCDMPSRRWNKPSIMITCEANYSNAHGTPWVYRHKNIGRLVGMPVPGTMTSVSWETLQDETLVFGIPIVGYRLPDGSYLENQQLEPDIQVANDSQLLVAGRDQQLEAAVEALLEDIDKAARK